MLKSNPLNKICNMSIKLRDLSTNKFIMDYDETNKSIVVSEFQPFTFSMTEGEWLYELVESRYFANSGTSSTPGSIYASFHSQANQHADATNTRYNVSTNTGVMYCEVTDMSNGIYITTYGTKTTYQYKGVYNYQFSAQIDMSSGSGQHIFIWLRKNGVDIPWTASQVAIQGTSAETIPSWNFLLDINAGDYIELMWSASSDKILLKAVNPVSPVPAIPSVIITTWKI